MGGRRAGAYLRDIRTAFGLIVERPNIGLVLEGLDDADRKRVVGSHVVFYRVMNGRIEIVRVLHQNMDATQHLPNG